MGTDVVEPLDINQAAARIAVVWSVSTNSPDTPLARWFEYRAYYDLVQYLQAKHALPSGYDPFVPDVNTLHDWLQHGTKLGGRFLNELRKLITLLQAAGGGIIDMLCRIYCALTSETAIGALNTMLIAGKVAAIHAALVAADVGLFLAVGLPLTELIGVVLSMGLLDDLCDCEAQPPQARR